MLQIYLVELQTTTKNMATGQTPSADEEAVIPLNGKISYQMDMEIVEGYFCFEGWIFNLICGKHSMDSLLNTLMIY